jgi:predicted RNA-binding protein YlqC (UPF0109 family)
MTTSRLPGTADVVRPLVEALRHEMDELKDRPESIHVELREDKETIVVWFRTPMLSERDLGHLLGLRADGVPPFNLFVLHDPVGVRVEMLVRI